MPRHDRREAGDGAGAQVVAVGEAAGQDDGREPVGGEGVGVPDDLGLDPAARVQCPSRLTLAVRARKLHHCDPPPHDHKFTER